MPILAADEWAALIPLCGFLFFYFIFIALIIVGMWKMFVKAGEPGWAAIVPIYNYIILIKISGKPLWWIVLFLIPCTAPIAAIIIALALAQAFGKSTAYAIGMIFLPFIFMPMLGFGNAQYNGTKSF